MTSLDIPYKIGSVNHKLIVHITKCYYMHTWSIFMRTTLDLSDSLLEEAMALTKIRTKTEVITRALENLIQKEKLQQLKNYYGKIDLDIDLDALRKRT